ncbi:MAG TPA: SPOR domain-containing protein [Myxococcaceae bacterium]|nr:SPOR domain-containing protein [Myxococcaceae bacterium]
MKEKFDLSLDNRQVVSLLISGLVVLGAVFVLGVVVGKKLAFQAQASEATDLLTALDAQAAGDAGPSSTGLTFQDELTQRPPELKADPPEMADAPPALTAAPEPKVELKAPEVKAPEPKAPEVKAEPKVAETKPAAPPASEAKKASPVAGPVATRGVTPDSDAAARAKDKRPAEAAANGPYSLQLSASQNKAEADRFAAKLRDRGYAPYIVEVNVPQKGVWYRVRMGSFPSKDAAQRYLQDFRRETRIDAIVAGQ